MRTREERINELTNRIKILEGRGQKNIKCGGVLRKLRRQLKNLQV